ncbi:hypothetical protein [Sphingobacterium anhuiense]|uniref:Uncharacterized protein n=1 Tax=Sphingobacterium anhuiense TaxID=493780 RepID=A0ABW5YUM0_9SPHI
MKLTNDMLNTNLRTNNTVAISLSYKKSGERESIKRALIEIKEDLGNDFLLHIKPNCGPQAGGLIDAMIEISSNISLSDYLKVLKDGVEYFVAYKILWEGLKKVFKRMQLVEETTEFWDYANVSIRFDDCDIIIYGYEKIFKSIIPSIFNILLANQHIICASTMGVPYEIHIPIQKDEETGEFLKEDCPDYSGIESYKIYWGIVYNYGYDRMVFDVRNEKLLPDYWS